MFQITWTQSMVTLSALVVARNAHDQLDQCLKALHFADELVIVLDRCTDNSCEIATQYTSNIYEGAWECEGARRNFARQQCKGAWVLEVDSDEIISDALAIEIREAIKSNPSGHFVIPVDNYIGNQLVRNGWGCHWGTSAVARLAHAKAKRWKEGRVHPEFQLEGPVHRLSNPIEHYIDKDFSDILTRLDRYTKARAADLRDNPKLDDGLWRNIRRIFSRFIKCYVMRKGYKEGKWGVTIALMAGLYPIISHLRANIDNGED